MRLTEPIETTGEFWLPEDPDTRLSGILRISETGEITVELAGMFGEPFAMLKGGSEDGPSIVEGEEPTQGRIVGVVSRGGPITLDGCIWTSRNFQLPSVLSRSTVHASRACIGARYEQAEEVSFSEFSLGVEGLDTWLGASGIEFQQDDRVNGSVIRYRTPEEIQLTLPNGVDLKFVFQVVTTGNLGFPIEAAVKQTVSAVIKPNEPQPISYYSFFAVRLCRFLFLALDQDVCIQTMTGNVDVDMSDGEKRRESVRIYGRFAPWTEKKPIISRHDALFLYPSIADQLSEMMIKWFEVYEALNPALDLYFASRTQASLFLDTKVLLLAQALETLHRRTTQETEMPEEEFTNLLEVVTRNCPGNRREWVSGKLRYANELTFRHRIQRLLEPFGHYFGERRARTDFINRICDTRNYLTHYDEKSTKNRASQPRELFTIHGKLEALFLLHLLRMNGFDDSAIDSLIQGNDGLRRKLDG